MIDVYNLSMSPAQQHQFDVFVNNAQVPERERVNPRYLTGTRTLQKDAKIAVVCGQSTVRQLLGLYDSVDSLRGYILEDWLIPVIVTYSVKEVYEKDVRRAIITADIQKAIQFHHDGKLPRINASIITDLTVSELTTVVDKLISEGKLLSFDIETDATGITCVGFCNSTNHAYVVETVGCSLEIWKQLRRLLESRLPKLAQNGVRFDIPKLREYGIVVQNYTDDTMVAHHCLFSEMDKGLDFMASVHLNVPGWKKSWKESKDAQEMDK